MTNTETDIKVLKRAKNLIKKGWTQDAYARNVDGTKVEPTDPDAVKFCMRGALYRACRDFDSEISMSRTYDYLHKIHYKDDKSLSLVDINDGAKTKKEVIDVFDKLIEYVEKW